MKKIRRGPKTKNLQLRRITPGRAPRRPRWLQGHARKKWESLVPQLRDIGLIREVDVDLLAAYCQAYGEFMDLTELITEPLIKTVKGNWIQHPGLACRNAAYKRMLQIGKEFGLSPKSRKDLDCLKQKAKESDRTRFFVNRHLA